MNRWGATGAYAGTLGIAIFVVVAPSFAQTRAQDRIDFANVRRYALFGTSPSPATPPTTGSLTTFGLYGHVIDGRMPDFPLQFNINGTVPFNYYSQDAEASPGTAAETTPELAVGFVVVPKGLPFQFSGSIDAASDRYTDPLAAANGDRFSATLRIDVVQPKQLFPDRDRLTPFVSYSPQWSYAPFFQSGSPATHDFTAGVTKLWDFDNQGGRVDTRAEGLAMWEFGMQATVQRRVVDGGVNSTAIAFSPSLKLSTTSKAFFPYFDPDKIGNISGSLAATVSHRWYDGPTGPSEEVWAIAPTFTLAWVLPQKWGLPGTPELDFQAAYSNQISTAAGNSFTQWTFGPILRVNWTF